MKKLITLAMVMALLLSLLACGCSNTNSNSPASSAGKTPSSTGTGDATGGDGTQEPLEMNVWFSATADTNPDENNATYQKLQQYALENANVKLVFCPYDWGDTFNQKLTMYASGGDLPSGVWCFGSLSSALAFLMGFEGEEWEVDDTDRKVRTDSWTEAVNQDFNYQYKCGLARYTCLNSNADAMYDLLNAICVRKSDIESVANIRGHQIAVYDLMNVATAGEFQIENEGLIEDAWKKMVIEAITAPSEADCHAVVAAWPDTMNGLGYENIVKERMGICEELVGGTDY